jgi:2-polyprenyl-3-methyl-5-hydroxy-6-metoxy-1,4-benzoquinol methylase
MITREECSICKSALHNIYSLNNIPVKLSCQNEFLTNKNKLSFAQCSECNTIQIDKLIPLEILYSDSHNSEIVGGTWTKYFKFFSDYVNPFVDNKNILEIGDPSAKIATLSNNYSKWIIIEPSRNNNIMFNEKIQFIDGFFDDSFQINTQIDTIIHSHVFEHIYDLHSFLKKCYEILDVDGNMIFGIPNMEYIKTQNLSPFLGIFFEHTIFLNRENVTYLLETNGFEIIEIVDYLNHSIIFNTKKSKPKMIQNIKITDYKEEFFESLNSYKIFIEKCNIIIKNNNKKSYIFGASYNTQYLLALGLCEENIHGLIDNSKAKQNKYFYGFNIKILSPSILENEDAIVILNNGVYNNEIEKQILLINNNTIIIENKTI